MKYRKVIGSFITYVLMCVAAPYAVAQTQMLGVLERVPGVYAGEPASYHVRALFLKRGKDWEAFPSKCATQACLKEITRFYPNRVQWHLGANGENAGYVNVVTPSDFSYYVRVGMQNILTGLPAKAKAGLIGQKRDDARGQVLAVANTQPFFGAVRNWKKLKPEMQVAPSINHAIRRQVASMYQLRMARNLHSSKTCPWRSKDFSAYESENQEYLIGIDFSQESRCTDYDVADTFYNSWFLYRQGAKIKYLGSGLRLIDHEEVSRNGGEVFIFEINKANLGGYKIFYDGFERFAEYSFIYH